MQEYIAPVKINACQIAHWIVFVAFLCQEQLMFSRTGWFHRLPFWRQASGIDKQLPLGGAYIGPDVNLNRDEQQIIMITGPNPMEWVIGHFKVKTALIVFVGSNIGSQFW